MVLSLAMVLSSVTSVDQYARADLQDLFHRALVTFALARTLNGLISTVQGTEIALEPAGVGVTLTPGQILDPVNDLVERFSWIMLGASISLGVQQVLLDVGQWWGVRLLVAVAGLLWLWSALRAHGFREQVRPGTGREACLGHAGGRTTQDAVAEAGSRFPAMIEPVLIRAFLVLLFLRFAVPAVLIANEIVYELFLQPRYLVSTGVIKSAGADIQQAGTASASDGQDQSAGIMDMLGRAFDSTRESLNLTRRVDYVKRRVADVTEHLIQLSVVFVLQAGILPLAFLWLLLHLLKALLHGSAQ